MSNYTKSTNFTAKDSLPTGDNNKVIRGSEFDTEFNAISVAVATKSDLAGPTFTGTTTIATADINGGNIDGTVVGASTSAAGTFTDLTATGTLNLSNLSVSFSQLDAGAVTLSSETFLDVDNQIPTNAAVIDYVAATIPTISEVNDLTATVTWANVPDANITESSVTQHQAALAITASQLSDVTSTAAELNLLDGSTANTVVNSKAVVYGSGGEIAATSYTGDGSALTGIDAAPSFSATASGAISNGDTVIVNSDGTVSAVAGVTENVGSATAITASGPQYSLRQGAFDSNTNKVVYAYRDGNNSEYGTAVVGTVSGTSISFGTPVVFESSASALCNVVYDPDTTNVVICYSPSTTDGYGIVGTVSGTSISFGTRTQFETGAINANVNGICYDTTNDKVVYAYRDGGNSNYGTAVVGTVSGTSISFGTPVVFESSASSYILPIFDPNVGKILIGYTDSGTDTTSIVGTVSGTSISFGTKVDIETASSNFVFGVYDSTAQKIMVFYTLNSGTASNAKVATISGTSVSYGTATELYAGYAYGDFSSGAYDSNANRCVFTFKSISPADGYIVTAQISGTDVVNATTAVAFPNNDLINTNATVFDSNENKIAVAFADNASGQNNRAYGFVYTAPSTNITSENYIGISNAAYSDTATATIQIVGSVDDAQTGLTAGQSYYVQNDGSLGTTAATPSVFAGTAVSATKLIVKG